MGNKYYALLEGDRLKLFPDKDTAFQHLEQGQDAYEFQPVETHIIYRLPQIGLLEENYTELSMCLLFQDTQNKMKNTKIKITIEATKQEVVKVIKPYSKPSSYTTYNLWLQAFKRTQRPIWVGPEIQSCFICEKPFSIVARQHHCRKCGTAVCH